jgi:hypothetical protein
MRVAPLLLVVLLLAAAGCGGNGGGGGGGGDRLSKSDFRSKADGICQSYERQIARATAGSGTGPGEIADTIDKVIPLIEKGQRELRDLRPPSDLEDKYKRWLDQGDDQVEEAKKLRDAARNNDSKGFRSSLERLQSLEKSQDAIGQKDLGLKTCARSG